MLVVAALVGKVGSLAAQARCSDGRGSSDRRIELHVLLAGPEFPTRAVARLQCACTIASVPSDTYQG